MPKGVSAIRRGGSGPVISVGGLLPFDGVGVLYDKGGSIYNAGGYTSGGAFSGEAALLAAAAEATADGGGLVVVPSGMSITLTANRTIGSDNVALEIRPGAMVTVPTGLTLTIGTREVTAGRRRWITLQGTGRVHFPGGSVVFPEWWGVTVDSTVQADMDATYDGFRAADDCFNNAGGIIDLAPGVTYWIGKKDPSTGAFLLHTQPNVWYRAADESTVFKLAPGMASVNSDIYPFRAAGNVPGRKYTGFTCDGNGTNNLQPSTGAQLEQQWFTFAAGDDVHIDVRVRNHAGARVVGIGDATNKPLRPYVRVRAETVGDAVPGNSSILDHTTVWMRSESGTAIVEVENATMAANSTALELHGTNEEAPLIRAVNIRYAFLPVAILDDSIGAHVGTIICDRVQCAVAPYVAGSFRMQHRIDAIVGTQADELYGFVDDLNVTGGLAGGSLLSIGRIQVESTVSTPTGDVAAAVRAGKFPGRLEVDSVSAKNMPLGILAPASPVTADATEVIIDQYRAVDCGRSSSATVGVDRAIWLTSGNKLKRLSLGKGVLRNTAGGSSPMSGWMYLNIPLGDFDRGTLDAGTVSPVMAVGGNYVVDRPQVMHQSFRGQLTSGSEYDIDIPTVVGTLSVMAAGSTLRVGGTWGVGATAAASPVLLSPSSSQLATSDTVGALCVFWFNGRLRIKNNLGETVSFVADLSWI